jgi:hypothetical protein
MTAKTSTERNQERRARRRACDVHIARVADADLLDDLVDAGLLPPAERMDRERAGAVIFDAARRMAGVLLRRKYPGRY